MPVLRQHADGDRDAVVAADDRDAALAGVLRLVARLKCGNGHRRRHRFGIEAVAEVGVSETRLLDHLLGREVVELLDPGVARRAAAEDRGVDDVAHAVGDRRLHRGGVLLDAAADAHRRDQQHLLAAFHRRLERGRIVEVGPPDRRPALGEVGQPLRRARQQDEVFRRHLVQQQLRRRIAEVAGRAGDDDLAHVSSPVLGDNHNECYGRGNKRERPR